jgi:hypothetical protein
MTFSCVVLVTTLVANAILDVGSSCIQEYTPCIFTLFINIASFLFIVMSRLLLMLRSKLRYGSSLLKLTHHISTIILRWLRIVKAKENSREFVWQIIMVDREWCIEWG